MAKSSKKKKLNVFRFHNQETGEHYTIRMSKEAFDKITASGGTANKYSRKLRKHTEFKITKKVAK